MASKIFTQRIERNNLTARTRLKCLVRKTIYFSKSLERHDEVMDKLISREYYQLV